MVWDSCGCVDALPEATAACNHAKQKHLPCTASLSPLHIQPPNKKYRYTRLTRVALYHVQHQLHHISRHPRRCQQAPWVRLAPPVGQQRTQVQEGLAIHEQLRNDTPQGEDVLQQQCSAAGSGLSALCPMQSPQGAWTVEPALRLRLHHIGFCDCHGALLLLVGPPHVTKCRQTGTI
jgi:hypothetical protein